MDICGTKKADSESVLMFLFFFLFIPHLSSVSTLPILINRITITENLPLIPEYSLTYQGKFCTDGKLTILPSILLQFLKVLFM